VIDALVAAMARRCGLEHPAAFAAKGGVWAEGTPMADLMRHVVGADACARHRGTRGTGRTTRTLLQALCALECGCSVEVVAADEEQAAHLRAELRRLAYAGEVLVGGPELPRAAFLTPADDLTARFADLRLVDHYAAEVAQRDIAAEFQGAPMTADTFAAIDQRVAPMGLRAAPDYLGRRVDPAPTAEWLL
jgi:hypothetical protein